jgi:hypothetical protein
LIEEEIKRRLNSGNACYHSLQNLLSSGLLSKNVKVRIYKTIMLHVEMGWTCSTNDRRGEKRRIMVGNLEGKETTRKTKI